MKDVEKIKNYYNDFWLPKNINEQQKSDLTQYEEEAMNYALNYLKNYFNKSKNKKLLEIGPGKGDNVIKFARMGFKVTAIDISRNSLKSCKELSKKYNLLRSIKLIQMDAHNMKFKSNQFDVIFIKTTLMHLNHIKVVKECKRVLKKNGILISIEPIDENLLIRFYRLFFSQFKETKPRYLKYKDLLIISKNFKKSYRKIFYLFSFISLIFRENTKFYKMISKILKKSENLILRVIPSLEKKCWLSVSIYIK
ncbi:MAG: class I SAM-dependent methyltransferase [Nanoarchaeota archaeon]